MSYDQPRKYPHREFGSSTEQRPVVVIGAGPVGMATALGLAQRGIAVTILEAADQVSFGSRAICVSRHSLEVADRPGFGADLESIVLPWVGGRSFHGDHEVLHFTMPDRPHDVRPPMVNVSQSEFEQVMVDAIEANPLITLYWQAGIAGFAQDADGVTLDIDTAHGPRHLRAAWVVAADGGRSRMRELAGLTLQGTSYDGRYVIADIGWDDDCPPSGWSGSTRRATGSTIIMQEQPNDIWRIDYQLDSSEDAEVETQEDRIRERITRHRAARERRAVDPGMDGLLRGARARAARLHARSRPVRGRRRPPGADLRRPRAELRHGGRGDAGLDTRRRGQRDRGLGSPEVIFGRTARRLAAEHRQREQVDVIMSPGSQGYRSTRDAVLALATTRPEFAELVNPRQSSATHAHLSPLTWRVAEGSPACCPGTRWRTAASAHRR